MSQTYVVASDIVFTVDSVNFPESVIMTVRAHGIKELFNLVLKAKWLCLLLGLGLGLPEQAVG